MNHTCDSLWKPLLGLTELLSLHSQKAGPVYKCTSPTTTWRLVVSLWLAGIGLWKPQFLACIGKNSEPNLTLQNSLAESYLSHLHWALRFLAFFLLSCFPYTLPRDLWEHLPHKSVVTHCPSLVWAVGLPGTGMLSASSTLGTNTETVVDKPRWLVTWCVGFWETWPKTSGKDSLKRWRVHWEGARYF